MGRKKSKTFSFIVGSRYGERSAQWNVAVGGEAGRTVCVDATGMSEGFHATLHISGENHICSQLEDGPHYIVSDDTKLPPGAYRVGLHILILCAALHHAIDPERTPTKDVRELERPLYDGAVEMSVMIWDRRDAREEWPGKAAGTSVEWSHDVDENTCVLVLRLAFPPGHPLVDIASRVRRRLLLALDEVPNVDVLQSFIPGRSRAGIPMVIESAARRDEIASLLKLNAAQK